MKITCQECQSNFSVADEKVAKTVVKIRCKKCGAMMVVDGNAGTTKTERASMPDDAPAISTRELEEEPAAAKAARREGGRDQGKDLFGDAAQAGSETEGDKPDAKLTGERNESSVLFSLKSLTDKDAKKEEKKDEKTTATADGSGLIDIRALAGKKDDDGPKKGVDDILSLGGGGAFGAALTAPNLAIPPPETGSSASTPPPEQKNNRGIIFAIVGSALFLGLVIVVAVVATRPTADGPRPEGSSTTTSGTPSPLAMNDPPKPTTGAPTTPPPSDTTTAKPPGQLPTSIPAGHGTPTGAATPKPSAAAPAETAALPAQPPKPLSLEEELRKKAGTPPPVKTAEAAGAGNFDRGAAASALASISIVGCKKPDGPTGSGHVTVTFEASGNVQSAIIDGGDFPGTPVGGCIAGKYRGAHVPAFTGSPVKVGKSFTL